MIIALDIISLVAIFVLWFITVFYIAVIKKYGYDNEYDYFWDKFKMWYSILLYVFIGISIYRSFVLSNYNILYSIISIILLVTILFFISLFYIIRLIIYKNQHNDKMIASNKVNISLLKKIMLIISVLIMVYSIHTCINWIL